VERIGDITMKALRRQLSNSREPTKGEMNRIRKSYEGRRRDVKKDQFPFMFLIYRIPETNRRVVFLVKEDSIGKASGVTCFKYDASK
jgi:hypothetical protein